MWTFGKPLLGALTVLVLCSGVWGALPSCSEANSTCPEFAACRIESSDCYCIAGYHINVTTDGCAADVLLDQTCVNNGSEVECVDNAICTNVGTVEHRCLCNTGYRPSTRNGSNVTVTFCVQVLALNESCSELMNITAAECLENASCSEGRCACNQGFHASPDNETRTTVCEMDKSINEICTQMGEWEECVDHATCVEEHQAGITTLLCRCDAGFHPKQGDSSVCEADKALGDTCTQLGGRGECAVNASCQSTNGGNSTGQCRCDVGFHPKPDNSSVCVADLAPGASCTEGQEGCVAHASCQTMTGTSLCHCLLGFHSKDSACLADVAPGGACNSSDECADNATCRANNETASLLCLCDAGFQPVVNGTSSTCVKDLALGANCTHGQEDCVANASCQAMNGTALCQCLPGFHTKDSACLADMAPGMACNSSDECVDNATCRASNETAPLLCLCDAGFRSVVNGTSSTCGKDRAHGETCTQLGGRGECVVSARCQPTDSSNTTGLCRCDAGFHPKQDNSSVCVADLALGASCTEGPEDCLANASCQAINGTSLCHCLLGFHTKDSACLADVIPGGTCTLGSSSDECVDNATCRTGAQPGTNDTLQCLCDVGFHPTLRGVNSTCEADRAHGETCTQLGGRGECVVSARCQPTDSSNTTGLCRCDAGFHPKQNNSSVCVADLALGASCTEGPEDCLANASCQAMSGTSLCQCLLGFHTKDSACLADVIPGGSCTLGNSSDECVDNAICRTGLQPVTNDTALQCLCDVGFHPTLRGVNSTCEADLPLNATCSSKGAGECLEGATCLNVAPAEQPEVLRCRCALDYYQLGERCQPALSPGGACLQNASSTECVSNATCRVAQSHNSSSPLQCQCDEQFHPAYDGGQRLRCLADTCSNTRDKCTQGANITSCTDATAFIKCMMLGSCSPQNTTQMSELASAMQYAEQRLPPGCDYNITTTCSDNVTSLLTNFLKVQNRNCTIVVVLNSKLIGTGQRCGTDKPYVLGKALVGLYAQQLSCDINNSSPKVTLGVSIFLTILLAMVSAVHAFVTA